MAPQHDFILDNQNGAQFRADLNQALEAAVGFSSGPTAPTTTYAYQYWADTTDNVLKQRDASNAGWIVRASLTADYGQAGQVKTSAGPGLPPIWTSITEDGAWTVAQDGTNAHFTFTGNGFDGTETNPDIYLVRGGVYNFTNASTTKGFQVQSTAGLSGTIYTDGISNNPALAPDTSTVSTLVWTVQMDAPSELYYHSTVDAGPGGNIYILDEAGGGALEWTLTANGTTDYIFAGPGFAGTETDPDIYVVRGQTYKFTNGMGAHPFQIQSTQGTSGTAYSDGITNNAVSNGTLTWEVRMDAPSTLYYQCTAHANMNGTIHVLDEGSAALPSGTADGEALIWENGAWAVGPVIGGVDYSTGGSQTSNYNAPTGFNYWNDSLILGLQQGSGGTLSNNDLTYTAIGSNGEKNAGSANTYSTGKYYWEFVWDAGGSPLIGVTTDLNVVMVSSSATLVQPNGSWFNNNGGTTVNLTGTYSVGDVIGFAIDLDVKKMWIAQNGVWENSGDPVAGTGAVWSGWSGTPDLHFAMRLYVPGDVVSVGNYGSSGSQTTIPYSIDKHDDVDTSTVAPTDGQALVWDNTAQKWEPGTVSGPTVRTSQSATTASIADGAADNVTVTSTGKAGQLLSIQTDAAAWVTVYATTAARAADASRLETVDPTPGSGVLAEVITTSAQTILLTPGATFFNAESTPASELYLKVVNKSGASAAIAVTLVAVATEV